MMPHWDWNGARVAPSVALASGYDLYYGPDRGPIMSTLYGPVKALCYLPAAWASTPTAAIMIAGALNVGFILLPLLLIQLAGGRGETRPRIAAWAGFLFAAGALLDLRATRYMATKVHVDAPAVGLGLLSCLVLMTAAERPGHRRLAVAAGLAVLAAWTKQVEAPLIAAQAVYLGVAYGRWTALRFLAWGLALGTLVSLVFVAGFGFDAMLFNIVTLPARHPWQGGWTWLLLSLVELAIQSSPFLLIILLALRAMRHGARGVKPRIGASLRDFPWTLLVLVALFLAPTSVVGRTIIGGDENSYYSLYYLLAAASLILARIDWTGPSEAGRRIGARVLYLLALGALCLAPDLEIPRHLWQLRDNPQEQAYEFARANPGKAYFPWNPLSTLMAEGELYHFDYNVYDRRLAGFKPTDAHFRAHIPPEMQYVLFHENAHDQRVLAFLPEFGREIELAELPDWIVYTRDEQRQDR
ncbi:MAG: hypothetical protein GY856_04545 [bacterium]|nr:hypothetical protein [bacterium]